MRSTDVSTYVPRGVEGTVVELLHDGTARSLDEIATAVPGDSFAQVFLAIDRLSREGLVRLTRSTFEYRVILTH